MLPLMLAHDCFTVGATDRKHFLQNCQNEPGKTYVRVAQCLPNVPVFSTESLAATGNEIEDRHKPILLSVTPTSQPTINIGDKILRYCRILSHAQYD